MRFFCLSLFFEENGTHLQAECESLALSAVLMSGNTRGAQPVLWNGGIGSGFSWCWKPHSAFLITGGMKSRFTSLLWTPLFTPGMEPGHYSREGLWENCRESQLGDYCTLTNSWQWVFCPSINRTFLQQVDLLTWDGIVLSCVLRYCTHPEVCSS